MCARNPEPRSGGRNTRVFKGLQRQEGSRGVQWLGEGELRASTSAGVRKKSKPELGGQVNSDRR